MNFLRKLFGKKKVIEPISHRDAVRHALRMCIEGYYITEDQFEALFGSILDSEVYGGDAAEVIDDFINHHGIKLKK